MERKPWNKTRSPPMTAHSFSCSGSNFSGSLDFGAGALYTFTHKKGVYTNPATSPAAAPRRLLRSRFRRAREGKKPGTQERGWRGEQLKEKQERCNRFLEGRFHLLLNFFGFQTNSRTPQTQLTKLANASAALGAHGPTCAMATARVRKR